MATPQEKLPAADRREVEPRVKPFPFLGQLKTYGLGENEVGGKLDVADDLTALMPEFVPPCFVVPFRETQEHYYNSERLVEGDISEALWQRTLASIKELERRTEKTLGDPTNPLIVAVRGSYKVQLPGMMLTLLNVGVNAQTARGLVEQTNNEQFAMETYATFVYRFATEVFGIEKEKCGATPKELSEMDVSRLQEQIDTYKQVIREAGHEFPEDPYHQLRLAMKAALDSWYAEKAQVGMRALDYQTKKPEVALGIQLQVFGNMRESSGTAVIFTRNIDTGKKTLSGDWLADAQGEELVSGERTPQSIQVLKEEMPAVFDQLAQIGARLEQHYREVQDMEVTVENGRLWVLQSRISKRTAEAAVTIANEMVSEGLISEKEALMRVTPEQIEQLLYPRIDPKDRKRAIKEARLLGKGVGVGGGAVAGIVALDSETAKKMAGDGKKVILVRQITNPEDVPGMEPSVGFLTQKGGTSSHAALFARSRGKTAVVGWGAMAIDMANRCFKIDGKIIKEGEFITIDGQSESGEVFAGKVATIKPTGLTPELKTFLEMASSHSKLWVEANADTPEDAQRARDFGAKGIGLCRTEFMFNDQELELERGTSRHGLAQAMLMANKKKERREPLKKLERLQRRDFEGIFRVMDGLPVTIRLLDMPMHEILPDIVSLHVRATEIATRLEYQQSLSPEERAGLDNELKTTREFLRAATDLHETNPMLGDRSVRALIGIKGLAAMQVRAIIKAACKVANEGVKVHPEIMLPLVSTHEELKRLRPVIELTADQILEKQGITQEADKRAFFKVGAMIEVPRATVTADQIAPDADFFSFGTNDLTQMTFGISRDDAEAKFLPGYVERGILPANPFQTLDTEGVGFLMKKAVELGRAANPKLVVGICGEHGGDPASIDFCHQIGLDYVSCSPFRVPVAILATAQAKIREENQINDPGYAMGLSLRRR